MKIAKVKPDVAPEVIEALRFLRQLTHSIEVQFAICELDNAGIFAAIDEASNYGEDPVPVKVSRCTCPPPYGSDRSTRVSGHHLTGCPGDPAEWGDMAYTTKEN